MALLKLSLGEGGRLYIYMCVCVCVQTHMRSSNNMKHELEVQG